MTLINQFNTGFQRENKGDLKQPELSKHLSLFPAWTLINHLFQDGSRIFLPCPLENLALPHSSNTNGGALDDVIQSSVCPEAKFIWTQKG